MKEFTGTSFKYTDENTHKIAFPVGGMGSGSFCVSGTGKLCQFALRHRPDTYNNPSIFAAVTVRSKNGTASKVLEGQIPPHKIFSSHNTAFVGTGDGLDHYNAGLPRFANHNFEGAFPFAKVTLWDDTMPVSANITAFSPFIPGDEDSTSLPVAGLEYEIKNVTEDEINGVFYFSAFNFMTLDSNFMAEIGSPEYAAKETKKTLLANNGFMFYQPAVGLKHEEGYFKVSIDDEISVDCDWYRGEWYDHLTMAWNRILNAEYGKSSQAADKKSPGATIAVPFNLKPGKEKKIVLKLSWYIPYSDLRRGKDIADDWNRTDESQYFMPWYAKAYAGIKELSEYWDNNYERLKKLSLKFSEAFFSVSLPEVLLESAASNLSILKSTTMLRQFDGRLWGWEGSLDNRGSCYGSCTHVWNYAQAMCHLFPRMERTLRETELKLSQDETGYQIFRSGIPLRRIISDHVAASDGQLGGIIKTYREWRISGDDEFVINLWEELIRSLEYCITMWDPEEKGVLYEPHHNTYDIEFWGAEPMGSGFYLGALKAISIMAKHLNKPYERYESLYCSGREYMEENLFNDEYFYQKTDWTSLSAKPNTKGLNAQQLELFEKEGPKYQYGTGCLSDGLTGVWLSKVCGLGDIIDAEKIKSHLLSVYKYNLKKTMLNHSNPQRGGYALGNEGGLLLCSWPKGGKPSLPFIYSCEVWTGVEHAVSSHLILMGFLDEGIEIEKILRQRYDGSVRNPFNEYECGSFYVRALSSYALLYAYSGVYYDNLEKVLYAPNDRKYKVFLAAETGFGTVSSENGKIKIEVLYGTIEVKKIVSRNRGESNEKR